MFLSYLLSIYLCVYPSFIMLHKRRKRMAPLFNSRLNSKSRLFPEENRPDRKNNKKNALFSILQFIIIITCVILFVLNSYAIFIEFVRDPTIISTKVSLSFQISTKSCSKTVYLIFGGTCNDLKEKQ